MHNDIFLSDYNSGSFRNGKTKEPAKRNTKLDIHKGDIWKYTLEINAILDNMAKQVGKDTINITIDTINNTDLLMKAYHMNKKKTYQKYSSAPWFNEQLKILRSRVRALCRRFQEENDLIA